jgi:hypothetical protein
MQSNFTPEAIALMGTVCDEAFIALRQTTFFPTINEEYKVRHRMASRVLAEVSSGERDPVRLRAAAMRALEF